MADAGVQRDFMAVIKDETNEARIFYKRLKYFIKDSECF